MAEDSKKRPRTAIEAGEAAPLCIHFDVNETIMVGIQLEATPLTTA